MAQKAWLATALMAAGIASGRAQQPPGPPSGGGTLLGDVGGIRTALSRYGVSLGLQSTDEVFGNPNGGRARGVASDGQNSFSLGMDLEKAIGLKGGTFNISSLQNVGHGISASNIDNLNLVSNVEAIRSAWLYELWYQQSFLGGGVDVRLGQIAADQEFMLTNYGGWFVNAAFGWPTLPALDLPSGGPSLPLATPGMRLRAKPSDAVTLLLAAFNGNPAGPGLNNPQVRDASGTLFRLNDGVFTIAEAQYAINSGKDAKGPPIILKVGAWYHHRGATSGLSATNGLTGISSAVAGSSIAREDWSAYAVADVMLLPGSGGKGGLAAFARVAAAPANRSEASSEFAGGLVYIGPFGRDGDQVGFAVSSVRLGQAVGGGALTSRYRFHGSETVLELSYQAQVLPWLQVQPDAQYILTPSGGIPDLNRPSQRVGSAAVLGLRTIATF